MYRGFKLDYFHATPEAYGETLLSIGKEIYEADKTKVEKELDVFLFSDNSLDGTSIQNAWFPQVNADVFISHARDDADMAIMLAGWLYETFQLRTFVDSCIWGHANGLLKEIDNLFCRNAIENSYDYKKRNASTSHVHMMLSSALTMMMDKTECLLFLETPSSILPKDGIKKTESPWLYLEIGMSQVIRKRVPSRRMAEYEKLFSKGQILEKAVGATYEVDLDHLSDIDIDILKDWKRRKGMQKSKKALDVLYAIVPQKKIGDSLDG